MILATLAFSLQVEAEERIEKYSSVARKKDGARAYEEQHEVTFVGSQVRTAKTRYLDSKGEWIGEMSSNFANKVTVPEYEYKDLRTGTSHGIRSDGTKMTLWHKNKEGKTESADFDENKFPSGTLLVGCQGLHYYLIDNLNVVREKKKIPIVYFIPGKLDYYRFTLKLESEDDTYVFLKLSIDNFFLNLLTSSLHLKYRKSDRRLVQFSGLSNITDENDQMQNVVIDYAYN